MTLEESINLFSKDHFATRQAGVRIIEVGKNYARCEMEVTECLRNAMGFVMGGALFTLADLAFAAAANHNGLHCVSASSSINYLSPVSDGTVTAQAKCLKEGRRTCLYSTEIHDQNGKLIAIVITNGINTSQSNH